MRWAIQLSAMTVESCGQQPNRSCKKTKRPHLILGGRRSSGDCCQMAYRECHLRGPSNSRRRSSRQHVWATRRIRQDRHVQPS